LKPTDIGNPDYFHKVVDCQWACPAHTPVPEYIRLIAQGRFGDAYMVNWKSNVFPGILGRTCDRPCEPACRRTRIDGKAVAIPMGAHKDLDAGVVGLVCYPNFWMDAVGDYIWTMRITAESASQCRIDLTWLVDGKAEEGKDYNIERLAEFWKITGEQDWKLCENNFNGIESSRYQPGPYAPVELEVAKFVEWYVERLREGVEATSIVG